MSEGRSATPVRHCTALVAETRVIAACSFLAADAGFLPDFPKKRILETLHLDFGLYENKIGT